jgi:hypoxanthine phosphoribosyltransferase
MSIHKAKIAHIQQLLANNTSLSLKKIQSSLRRKFRSGVSNKDLEEHLKHFSASSTGGSSKKEPSYSPNIPIKPTPQPADTNPFKMEDTSLPCSPWNCPFANNETPLEIAPKEKGAYLTCFVIMPFGNNNEYEGKNRESNYVYNEIIYPGVLEASKKRDCRPQIMREVDRSQAGSITAAIVKSIVTSDVVIVDITGRNPNVFLELGMRYALRNRVTVLMAQEGTQIPFDIRGYRYLEYNRFEPQLTRRRLAETIIEGLTNEQHSDSVVFDIFRDMTVSIPGMAESRGENVAGRGGVMSWMEYMERIEYVSNILSTPIEDARFVPDALIGISNGGMVAADLIGKRVFSRASIPVLSFWAERLRPARDTVHWFFDNQFNDAMINVIKNVAIAGHPKTPATILLIDDHMGTGQTAVQAINYLQKKLGNDSRIVFFPLVSRRQQFISTVEAYLPYEAKDDKGNKLFNIDREQYVKQLNTPHSFFPYLKKEIRLGTGGD